MNFSFSNSQFGFFLKSLRRNYGLTINEMSDKLGVSPKTLSRIEKSEAPISVAKFFEFCECVEISPIKALEQFTKIENVDYSASWPIEAQNEHRLMIGYLKAKYNFS